jgi:hypothetical protein
VIQGHCLCGQIVYEADGEIRRMAHCHCSICRRSSGAAFATFVAVPAASFRFTSGEDRRRHYESSPGIRRSFCPDCGSNVPTAPPGVAEVFMPAGGLEGALDVPRTYHIFVGSKAPWYTITDSHEQHDVYPPRSAR